MEFGPIRAVKGDMILSPYLPRLGVRISEDYIYLGDLQYLAQGTYHVEDFIYLCPNSQGHVTRLLLVQFDGFLDHKEGTYPLPGGSNINLAGDEYNHTLSTASFPSFDKKSAGAHLAHATDYVRQRSYTLAGEMIYHTFLRLVTDDHRNRFSIHHLERIEDANLPPDHLAANTAQQQEMLARALRDFTIVK